MTRRLTLALLTAVAFAAVPLVAHEGHDHKVLGVVTMAAPDHVMLKDKAGKEVTVHITRDTKVLKDKKAATVEDVQNGMRVVITAVTEKVNKVERMRAKTIELGAAAPAAK